MEARGRTVSAGGGRFALGAGCGEKEKRGEKAEDE